MRYKIPLALDFSRLATLLPNALLCMAYNFIEVEANLSMIENFGELFQKQRLVELNTIWKEIF